MGKIRPEFLWTDPATADQSRTPAYLKDEKTGLCYSLPCGRWTIGRMDDVDIDIPLKTDDLYISREQAEIIVRKNFVGEYSVYIRDKMGKPNPSRINGQKIVHSIEFQLYDGDVLRMGLTPMTVHLWPKGKDNFNKKQMM